MDSRMDLHDPALAQQFLPHPMVNTRFAGPGSERCTPALNLSRGYIHDVTVYPVAKCCSQLTFRIDKPNQDGRGPGINLMESVGPYEYGAALSPFIFGPTANQ